MKSEKYLSGVLHWSEVLEMFEKLDIDDKEKFLYSFCDDEERMKMINEVLYNFED